MKPESWLQTLNCAVEGLLHAVKAERHMRWHALATLAVLVMASALPIAPVEFALLCLAAGGVIVVELLNTALEATVDLASPEFHPLAKIAKDVAAGAVLVASFAAAGVGWVILYPKVGPGAARLLEAGNQRAPVGIPAIVLAVLVLVVLTKATVGRGHPLHGGFPSGHAAVAFALATILTLRTEDPVVGVLSGLLALMVGHSRLLHRIHTRSEVVWGALLGAAVAATLYWLVG
jgi:diacylglycerol kinase (ATP)